MPKSFTFHIDREPERIIADAKRVARRYGATIKGDGEKGSIAGEGYMADYAISGNHVLVTVRKKPPLVPWFLVKAAIREFLG